MLTYLKHYITRFLMCLSLLMTTVGYAPIVCLSVAALSVGCAETGALEARFPHARIHRVCAKPKVVGWDANEWVYTPGGMPVSSTAEIFPLVSARAHVVYTFDATAPEGSTRLLTMPDNQINCAAWLHAEIEQWCPLEPASFEKRADPRYVAQSTPEVRSPFLQGVPTAAFAPNCQTLVREGMKKQAHDDALAYGRKVGRVIGGAKAGWNFFADSPNDNFRDIFVTAPDVIATAQRYVANKLDEISNPPEYTDPELANIAQAAFDEGYGEGMAQMQRQFAVFEASCTLLIIASGPLAAAAETAGAKALRLALTRARTLPVFLPSAIGGGGAFLKRLPKAPPTTSTAPTFVEPRMPAPASITRAPSAPPPPTPPSTNAATNAVGAAATRAAPSGQLHHGISDAVHKALENHEKLKGLYKLRDPRFTARAATPEAHNGYQDWHVALDKEVAKYIRENKDLDPKKFESWLRKRYMKPDLVERFPGGLGENK